MKLAILILSLILNSAAAQTGRTVTLNWTPSTSPGLTGVNVYRGGGTCATSANFSKITATPVALTSSSYDDTLMPAYGKYCYYVTAVVVGVAESGPSNKSDADVPPKAPTGLTSVVPAAASVRPGESVQFVANVPASWSLYPPIGTISATGLYRAPFGITGNNRKVTVQASDGTSTAAATVTIRK